MKNKVGLISLIVLLLLFVTNSFADTWGLPTPKEYCSDNKKFCFKVIPKKLESQLSYFQDKVDAKENAGANKTQKENYCKGIFYARNERGKLEKKWTAKLVNEVSPVNAIVSNDGKYIVTFDNWHSVGYGNDVVAIYSSTGELIKRFGLDYFLTQSDINNLPASVSSIWWYGKRWIDEKKKELVLEVVESEQDKKYFQIRFDLAEGKLLDEKRNRLANLTFLISPIEKFSESELTHPNNSADKAIEECFNNQMNSTKLVSSEILLNKASSKELPEIGTAAKAVRATGIVVAEILVNESGEVGCAKITSGHPLLRDNVLKAIKNWKFDKSEQKLFGKLAFHLRWALVAPDGTILK